MKKKIIIIYPLIFREFDYLRFELNHLSKEFDVEVHEVVKILDPELIKIYDNRTFCKKKIVKRFDNLRKWKEEIKINSKKFNLFVILFDEPDSFKKFLVRKYLSSLNLKIIKYSPNKAPKRKITFELLINKIKTNLSLKTLFFYLRNTFFRFLSKDSFRVDSLLVMSGHDKKLYKKNNLIGSIETVHSYDISNTFINEKSKLKKNKRKNYILLIDTPGPRFFGDEKVALVKSYHTPEKWFPAINNFFSFLELNFKSKIKIAPHPKTKPEKFPKDFNYREVVFDKLSHLVKNSKMVISKVPGSNALVYAAYYNKPILFIYSNEMIKHKNYMNSFKDYYKALGCKPINIDNNLTKKEILKILRMKNKKKYRKYVNNYGTARKDKLPNYLIIKKVINKL